MKTRILINGAKGRMGQALVRCSSQHSALELVSQLDAGDDLVAALPKVDCVIDFTLAEFTQSIVEACVAANKKLVIGTTGQDADTRAAIAEAAKKIPIVFAPNFSIGVNTLFWLTRKAAEILGPGFDLEVVEMHHRLKKDSPSGTARRLAEILAEVRNLSYETHVAHGREGMPGERPGNEIGMHAIRGGDVVGDHTVIYAENGERLELTHKASSRDTFANGALRAAAWLAEKSSGLYDMQDVLGLND